jgi:hypothetical protein
VVSQFANVHTNPTPLLIGVFLLLPGSVAAFVLPLDHTPAILQCALISGVNLVPWYFFWWASARIAVFR